MTYPPASDQPHTPEQGPGREADTPAAIPARGWWQTLLRVRAEINDNHANLIAASIAFYGLLALFPAIAAFISLWGMIFDPDQVQAQIRMLSSVLPSEASTLIEQQASAVAAQPGSGLGATAIGGLVLTLFSASKGVRGFMAGLNIMYNEREERGLIRRTLITWLLTAGLILMTIVTLGSITLLPALIARLPFGGMLNALLIYIRWPLLLALVMMALTILYRFGPSRSPARLGWVSAGSVAATLLWLLGSIGFSIYVRNFASYNETYGAIGAVVILLMWFWLSAFIVLLGASLNCELERQTEQDTTTGRPKPMGERGAWAADTVAGEPRTQRR
ncbi:membrane protein [Kushneria sinocarnis]|uniref:Membrane protein n=1 Tax=Kushneria sinocarnis TaxID=595502 RepID=A0A420WX25_9GAMM|nr:YihY/virulence factor BrkB family protein [Kushneria sinocarnis]RKR04301.1 membrane protein [Kushneria sinocarnis]